MFSRNRDLCRVRGRGRGVLGAFTPLDLSPVLWLDASDESTITESSGSVSQWDDKSGNGYHATQGVGASQPTTGATTVNGLNVLDTNYDFMNLDSGFLSYLLGDLTILAVYLKGGTGFNHIIGGEDGGGSTAFAMSVLGGGPTAQQFQAGTKNTYTTNNVPDDANAHVHMLIRDDTAGTIAGYANNVLCRSVSGNADKAAVAAYIGSLTGSASIQGSWAEIIAIPSVADADTRTQVHDYLNAKWGIS